MKRTGTMTDEQRRNALDELTLPHCNASERIALGSMLIDNEAVDEVLAILGSTKEEYKLVFYEFDHEMIYCAMLALHRRHEPVDQVTVSVELDKVGYLQSVGGAAYIASLASALTSSRHAGKAAQVVYEMYVRRRLLDAAIDAVANYSMHGEDLDEVNRKTEKAFFEVLEEYAERQPNNYTHHTSDGASRTVYRFRKNSRDMVHATVGTYKNRPVVSMRVFHTDTDGNEYPVKHGLTVSADKAQYLLDAARALKKCV